MLTRHERHSYSEAVKSLLANDVLKNRSTEKEKLDKSSTTLKNTPKSFEYTYVDTLRMSKRKKVIVAIETIV